MKQAEDIANLFQQVGVQPTPYQEIARQQEQQRADERWPLLSAVKGAAVAEVPSVARGVAAASGPFGAPPTQAAQQAMAAPANSPAPPTLEPHSAAPPAAVPPAPMPAWPQAASLASFDKAAAPDRAPAAPAVFSKPSPLAGLASMRSSAASEALRTHAAADALPNDLPSVFARLAGAGTAGVQAAPAPAWQPHKGHA